MDEKTAQESMQDWLQELTGFENADVTINDYGFFDGPRDNGPFVIIENSDRFSSIQTGSIPEDNWPIPILLLEPFTTDKETLDNFRDHRQTIITKVNDLEGHRTPVPGADIDRVFGATELIEWYGPGVSKETAGAFPLYIFQRIILNVRTF